MTQREPPAASQVTARIANRVAALRKLNGWSQEAMAAKVAELGLRWTRDTVAKLERGRRETISVDELLVLAVVLGVPPVSLLFDPGEPEPAVISDKLQTDAWAALLWAAGRRPLIGLHDHGDHWYDASEPLRQAWDIAEASQILATLHAAYGYLPTLTYDGECLDNDAGMVATERRLLMRIKDSLAILENRFGSRLPKVSDLVLERSRELGIILPGDDEG